MAVAGEGEAVGECVGGGRALGFAEPVEEGEGVEGAVMLAEDNGVGGEVGGVVGVLAVVMAGELFGLAQVFAGEGGEERVVVGHRGVLGTQGVETFEDAMLSGGVAGDLVVAGEGAEDVEGDARFVGDFPEQVEGVVAQAPGVEAVGDKERALAVGVGAGAEGGAKFAGGGVLSGFDGGEQGVGEPEGFQVAAPVGAGSPVGEGAPVGREAQGFGRGDGGGRQAGQRGGERVDPGAGFSVATNLVEPADEEGGVGGVSAVARFHRGKHFGETGFVGAGKCAQTVGNVAEGAARVGAEGVGPAEHGGAVVAPERIGEEGAQGVGAPFGVGGPFGEEIEPALARGGIAGVEQNGAEGDFVDGGIRTVDTEGGFKVVAGLVEAEAAASEFALDAAGVGGAGAEVGRERGEGGGALVGLVGEQGVGGPGENEVGVAGRKLKGLLGVAECAGGVAQTAGEIGSEFPGLGVFGGDFEHVADGFGGLVEAAGGEPLAGHAHGGALMPPRVDPYCADERADGEGDGGIEGAAERAMGFQGVKKAPPEVAGIKGTELPKAATETGEAGVFGVVGRRHGMGESDG